MFFYNPNYLIGRDRRIKVQGQPKKKLGEALFQKQAGGTRGVAQVVEHLLWSLKS
jgi:hypothetical protein